MNPTKQDIDSARWMDSSKAIEFRVYDNGDSDRYQKILDAINDGLNRAGITTAIIR